MRLFERRQRTVQDIQRQRFERRRARSKLSAFRQLLVEPLEDRRLLSVLLSDTFNRADAGTANLGTANNSLGGTGTHYYTPVGCG